MSNASHRRGFEESVLYSDDDYEPYGFVSTQLVPVSVVSPGPYARFGPYEREIEAAVLRRLECYPGC